MVNEAVATDLTITVFLKMNVYAEFSIFPAQSNSASCNSSTL